MTYLIDEEHVILIMCSRPQSNSNVMIFILIKQDEGLTDQD